MRLGPLVVLLILSFPVLEAFSIFWLVGKIGWGALLYLALSAAIGVTLIRIERVAWGMRLMASLQSGANPLASLFASSRILLAGGLLIFPGLFSDALALILLLLPSTWLQRRRPGVQAANDDVLEGEFRRETDDTDRLR
jgi:UPF0716 protein FxsA